MSEVTLSGGMTNNPRLQLRHPGVHFLKGYFWLVVKHENKTKQKPTTTTKNGGQKTCFAVNSLISKLQNSPYFCVNSSTHEQSTKAENGERDWGDMSSVVWSVSLCRESLMMCLLLACPYQIL